MSETMAIEDYLEAGGVLTSPANAPPRYRGELMRLMAAFVDSELAGSAGFADAINYAPGVKERIAAAIAGFAFSPMLALITRISDAMLPATIALNTRPCRRRSSLREVSFSAMTS